MREKGKERYFGDYQLEGLERWEKEKNRKAEREKKIKWGKEKMKKTNERKEMKNVEEKYSCEKEDYYTN